MSDGMWKKLAGVFVEFESDGTTPKKQKAPASPASLATDADDLLAQLEGRKQGAPPRPRRARTEAPAAQTPPPAPAEPAPPKTPTKTALEMTVREVYAEARIADSSHSAEKILKMIAGLAMFPPEQQRAMVQALDAADDTWAEAEVLEDARGRQSALRSHLRAIDAERSRRLQDVQGKVREAELSGKANLQEIDRQLAELQKLREQQVRSTADSMSRFQAEAQKLEADAEQARRGISEEINRLSGLISFFTGGGASSA